MNNHIILSEDNNSQIEPSFEDLRKNKWVFSVTKREKIYINCNDNEVNTKYLLIELKPKCTEKVYATTLKAQYDQQLTVETKILESIKINLTDIFKNLTKSKVEINNLILNDLKIESDKIQQKTTKRSQLQNDC